MKLIKHFLIWLLISIPSISYGQSKSCNTNELYSFLHSKGVADKEEKSLIKCTPIVTEANGNGVYSFGIEETDSFTFFYILKGSQIHFINNSQVENIFSEVSAYMKGSSLSIEKKIFCFEKIIEITKAEIMSSNWSLPSKKQN